MYDTFVKEGVQFTVTPYLFPPYELVLEDEQIGGARPTVCHRCGGQVAFQVEQEGIKQYRVPSCSNQACLEYAADQIINMICAVLVHAHVPAMQTSPQAGV